MHRRTAGMMFIGIAAFLYATKYISAALFASNVSSWDRSLFRTMLSYVGNGPILFSILSLIMGLVYLVTAEFENQWRAICKIIKKNWDEIDREQHNMGE
jgi:hypothetical protein